MILIAGEAMLAWGQEVYDKSLYLFLDFAVKLKLPKKIKSSKKGDKNFLQF